MINKSKAVLLFLVGSSLPCFAGGLKGNFIDDQTIAMIILGIFLVHAVSIVAYASRLNWLKVICGILYLPIFLIPLVMMIFSQVFIILFIPMLAFYYYVIIQQRK